MHQELKSVEEKIEISDRNSDVLTWQGEKGNSKRIPLDTEGSLSRALSEFGVDGIEYKDGDVDFSPVSKYEIPFKSTSELYKTLSGSIKMGTLDTRTDFNSTIRTQWQSLAKKQIVEQINQENNSSFIQDLKQKTGIRTELTGARGKMTIRIFDKELSRLGLTLHETADCSKIQFVPTIIHDAFKHSGGTAEMLERLLSGDRQLQNAEPR